MEAEIQTIEKPILERLAEKLMQAQQELDELTLQLALGKAEAKDKFEEVKADFKYRLQEFKFTTIGKILGMAAERMQAHIEELEDHLSAGKADTHNAFELQLTRISNSIRDLELEVKEKFSHRDEIQLFRYDIEKFKLKLAILRLRFELKSIEMRDEFYDGLAQARKAIHAIKKSSGTKIHDGIESLENFKDEIEEVFVHMRKAIKSL